MVLLVGPPGAGKSSFCQQAALRSLAVDRPVIFVTTESGASKAEAALKERGLGAVEPGLLNFIDAYSETVGLSAPDRPDTVLADCGDLSSIGIAISKLQDRIGRKGVLLVFDSLVSPYLLSAPEVTRFLRLTLSRFAGEGNSVLTCMDEGCGKEEDLGAMISVANGVLRMDLEKGQRVIDVLKHPKFAAARIVVPTDEIWRKRILDTKAWDVKLMKPLMKKWGGGEIRKEVGDYVSIFWPNFARWSSILWDPRRFPKMRYDLWVDFWAYVREMIPLFPWHMRLLLKTMLPKEFSTVKDMKKPMNFINKELMKRRRYGIMEYLDNVSKTNEHYIRVHESCECCGFENVGATVASVIPPVFAGICRGLEKEEREWNALETRCIGLGDPYCEFKLIPGETGQLKDSLRKDLPVIERIHERLMKRLMGFLIEEKPLVERPRLGTEFLFGPEIFWPALARERYRMAFRMGGTKAGKEVGERLMDAGVGDDDAVRRVVDFLEHCKVGKVAVDETVRIRESCESFMIGKIFTELWEEPSCFFTTGFLNGFFSAVKNQHVKETKCLAIGDSYCEWEFR